MVIILKLAPSRLARCLIAAQDFLEFPRRYPKLLTAAAGLALCATTTADVPASRITPIRVSQPDPRIARLEKFFRTYHCPTPYHTSDYLRAADGYGLDYRLLPAVSIRETRCGVEEQEQHNHWGYNPGGPGFPSVEAGIDFVAQRLARHPLYKGKTLQDMLFTYNPRPAYPEEVRRIMRQVDRGGE